MSNRKRLAGASSEGVGRREVAPELSRLAVGDKVSIEMQQRGGGLALDETAFAAQDRQSTSALPAEKSDANGGFSANCTPLVYAVIPVFNRLHFTRECIRNLEAQTFRPIKIIVADGGSTDGTVDSIRAEFPDVVVLSSATELWWAGAMAMGITHALQDSRSPDDCLLMMNNDTQIPKNYVESLMDASERHGAAVGALVVDSRDSSRILDAGEYIDWANYSFPVKDTVGEGEKFCDDVDVLPGRGSLVPLRMIRASGNVDALMWPHYLSDYEFFYRLKGHGFRLGVCYETHILAHIEETGIVPTSGRSSFRSIWREAFSRRSMSNVVDQWRFVSRHAPEQHRLSIRLRLARRVITDLTLRTPLRPLFFPIYWVLSLPRRILRGISGQSKAFRLFTAAVRAHGANVLCRPGIFPGSIRLPLYLIASPGPLPAALLAEHRLDIEELMAEGILRPLDVAGWYALATLDLANRRDTVQLRKLFWTAWNPLRKFANSLVLRKKRQKRGAQ